MSVQAIASAFDTDLDGTDRLVLFALANHASKNTETLFPSVALLAYEAHVSERTLQRVLRRFEELGYLVRVRQATRTRPATYRLHLDHIPLQPPFRPKGDRLTPFGESPTDARGDKPEGGGVTNEASKGDTAMSPEPLNPQEEPKTPPTPSGGGAMLFAEEPKVWNSERVNDEFQTFYKRYPLKKDPDATARAFRKARRQATLQELLDGVDRYVEEKRRLGSDTFKYPATWLNAGAWKSEADPAAGPRTGLTPEEARRITSWPQLSLALQRAGIDPYSDADRPKRREFYERFQIPASARQ